MIDVAGRTSRSTRSAGSLRHRALAAHADGGPAVCRKINARSGDAAAPLLAVHAGAIHVSVRSLPIGSLRRLHRYDARLAIACEHLPVPHDAATGIAAVIARRLGARAARRDSPARQCLVDVNLQSWIRGAIGAFAWVLAHAAGGCPEQESRRKDAAPLIRSMDHAALIDRAWPRRFAAIRGIGIAGGAPGINAALETALPGGYTTIVLSNYDPPAAEGVAEKIREWMGLKDD